MILNLAFGLFFWLYAILSVNVFLVERLLALFGQERLCLRYVHTAGKFSSIFLLAVGFSRVIVHHPERVPRRRPLCVVSNHQSYADILAFFVALPRPAGYIAKASLKRVPVINLWMQALRCYFLRREDLRSGIQAIRYGVERIRRGQAMIIFPEGTRSRGPNMRPFHRGSFRMALDSKAYLVPVSIEGTYKLLEERGRVRRADVHVLFHPPIDCSQLSRDEERALPERVFTLIQEGQQALYRGDYRG